MKKNARLVFLAIISLFFTFCKTSTPPPAKEAVTAVAPKLPPLPSVEEKLAEHINGGYHYSLSVFRNAPDSLRLIAYQLNHALDTVIDPDNDLRFYLELRSFSGKQYFDTVITKLHKRINSKWLPNATLEDLNAFALDAYKDHLPWDTQMAVVVLKKYDYFLRTSNSAYNMPRVCDYNHLAVSVDPMYSKGFYNLMDTIVLNNMRRKILKADSIGLIRVRLEVQGNYAASARALLDSVVNQKQIVSR